MIRRFNSIVLPRAPNLQLMYTCRHGTKPHACRTLARTDNEMPYFKQHRQLVSDPGKGSLRLCEAVNCVLAHFLCLQWWVQKNRNQQKSDSLQQHSIHTQGDEPFECLTCAFRSSVLKPMTLDSCIKATCNHVSCELFTNGCSGRLKASSKF